MSVYRETDGEIVREYKLDEENQIFTKRTERALIEIIPTKEFGKALFIDGELQLTEKDEYIYHEMLVHPCLAMSNSVHSICVIGGGDGCAVREILKWEEVDDRKIHDINIVDWDEELTNLFKDKYSYINDEALNCSCVSIENEDIQADFEWENSRNYDVIFVDLLDPDFSPSENTDPYFFWNSVLFATKQWIDPYGSIVINAGGITPWGVDHLNTLLNMVKEFFEEKWNIHLYKVFVPSFGREWCFILLNQKTELNLYNKPSSLRYFSKSTWEQAYRYGWCSEYLRNIDLNISHQLDLDD